MSEREKIRISDARSDGDYRCGDPMRARQGVEVYIIVPYQTPKQHRTET